MLCDKKILRVRDCNAKVNIYFDMGWMVLKHMIVSLPKVSVVLYFWVWQHSYFLSRFWHSFRNCSWMHIIVVHPSPWLCCRAGYNYNFIGWSTYMFIHMQTHVFICTCMYIHILTQAYPYYIIHSHNYSRSLLFSTLTHPLSDTNTLQDSGRICEKVQVCESSTSREVSGKYIVKVECCYISEETIILLIIIITLPEWPCWRLCQGKVKCYYYVGS